MRPGPHPYGFVRSLQAYEVGGGSLIVGETNAMGIDFACPVVHKQMRVTTSSVSVDSDPAATLTYTSPSVKLTRRASGVWTLTNGTTELPYEWDASGNPLGIFIEEGRTNLILRSQEFDSASWNKSDVGVTADATTAPDGTSTADYITASNTNDVRHFLYQGTGGTNGTDVYTISCFVKKANYDYAWLNPADGSDHYTFFNINTGTVGTTAAGSTAAIMNASNGWYRISITTTPAAAGTLWVLGFANADNDVDFAATTGQGMYAWGFQAEVGEHISSHIATAGAQVTRAKDQITLATSAYPHSDSAGTLVAAGRIGFSASAGTHKEMLGVVGASTENRHSLIIPDGTDAMHAQTLQTASTEVDLTLGTFTADTNHKLAYAYTANDCAGVLNAGTVQTDVSAVMPTVTTMHFGQHGNASLQFNGHLRQVTYLARRASNAELQARTT